jgi:hypothetical protein
MSNLAAAALSDAAISVAADTALETVESMAAWACSSRGHSQNGSVASSMVKRPPVVDQWHE